MNLAGHGEFFNAERAAADLKAAGHNGIERVRAGVCGGLNNPQVGQMVQTMNISVLATSGLVEGSILSTELRALNGSWVEIHPWNVNNW